MLDIRGGTGQLKIPKVLSIQTLKRPSTITNCKIYEKPDPERVKYL
jgi:hypothetical protein